MAGWHRPDFGQSREALLAAIDSACAYVTVSPDDMGDIEVPVLLSQFRRQCAEALPELVGNSTVAFKSLEAPLSTLEERFRGCVLDSELFSRISFTVRGHILTVFFQDRFDSCREQLIAYFETHEPPAHGWTLSSLQRFEGFGPYTLYSLLKKVLPTGEREQLFEEVVLAHLPSTPAIESWQSAYRRPKPKRPCAYVWEELTPQHIADILVNLEKPRSDPSTHRWGFDSLQDWVDDDGVKVGASAVYHFSKRARSSKGPGRDVCFAKEVLPFLPPELVTNYAPKPYKKERRINRKPDEGDATAFRDVLEAHEDRFLRWEALHALFVCEENPHAFEYLKMDITDYLFEQFPGVLDEVFPCVERCLHLYEKRYKGPRSRPSVAGLRNYIVSTVSRRQVKFWGGIQRPSSARVIPSHRHRLLKMGNLIRPVRGKRDLFPKHRFYPFQVQDYPIEVWARVLEWISQQKKAGLSVTAIWTDFWERMDALDHSLESDDQLFVAENHGVEVSKVVTIGEGHFEGGVPRLAANGE